MLTKEQKDFFEANHSHLTGGSGLLSTLHAGA